MINNLIKSRAEAAGLEAKELERAIESFLSMLGEEELKMFVKDMSGECCSSGCSCK